MEFEELLNILENDLPESIHSEEFFKTYSKREAYLWGKEIEFRKIKQQVGEWAWDYCLPFLKTWRSNTLTFLYPMNIEMFIKNVFKWQFDEAENNKDKKLAFKQAVACLGKKEIEKRLKELEL